MRKSISLVLVAVMLFAAIAVAIPTSAASAKNIDYVEAQYFTSAPTIDGYISEAEWGEYTVMVEATDCETKNGSSPWKFFLYWRTGEKSDYSSWYYYLWLRWDEQYFYIGLKNYDPDKHSLKNGTTNTWDGDALQTRIDPMGPNAVVQGKDFTVTGDRKKPWSGEKTVPDFLFGYVEIAGGFSEAWENSANKGMTSFSENALGVTKTVVAPAGSNYSTDTQAGITTYEIAIPWSYMKLTDKKNNPVTELTYEKYSYMNRPQGGIGREFGMSVAVLDDGNNADPKWDAFMTWGSGICNAQQEEGAKTCTGSNSVTLSDKQYTPQSGYKTYDPTSLLDAKFGNENQDPMNVYYDYLAGDIYKENPISYDQLSVLKYDTDADQTVWGAPAYNGKITNIGGDHGNVLDYRFTDPVQTYIDTAYDKDTQFRVPTSFTFQFDICYTGTEINQSSYDSAIYNWFGGSDGHSFRIGYFFNDKRFEVIDDNGADSNAPTIIQTNENVNGKRVDVDFKKDTWYTWRFQYDNESCSARLWIDDLSTDADNVDSPWGKEVIAARWRYFYYSSQEASEKGTLLLFRQMNTQLMYDNVRVYNYAYASPRSEINENKPNNNGGTTIKEETGGGKLSLDDAYKKDGKWYIPIPVKSEYLSAIQLSFTLKFDTAKAAFDAVKGLEEGTYTVESAADGEYVITINNFNYVKTLKAGDTYFEIVLNATDDKADITDIVTELSDSYRYTVTTGDGLAFIILAAVVATVGCAVIITVRKRRTSK